MFPASVIQPLQGMDTGVPRLPDSILLGCRYWLELYIDPPRLPQVVPVAPDFSSRPHYRFRLVREAYQSGPG